MTSNEFTIWLKGFMTACNEYSPTPKQWDTIKEELEKVDKFVETPGMFQVHPQPPYPGVPIGPNGTGTPNMHDLVDRYPWGAPKVWGLQGTIENVPATTSGYSQVLTTTGTTPVSYTLTTGSATVTYVTPDMSTYVNPQSGSWHYTNKNNYINPYNPFTTQTDDDLKSKKTKKK